MASKEEKETKTTEKTTKKSSSKTATTKKKATTSKTASASKKTATSKKTKKPAKKQAEPKTKKKKSLKEDWPIDDDSEEMDTSYEYNKCPPVADVGSYNIDEEEKPTLTKRGLEMLQKELKDLKQNKRLEVAERIRQARALGDISENSEYEEAKRDQAMIEARIQELEHLLKSAVIVDEAMSGIETCVQVGTKVRVENLTTKTKETIKIVGTLEADPLKNLISNSSPFGRAMMGRQNKEVVKVPTPEGFVKYRILEIKKG